MSVCRTKTHGKLDGKDYKSYTPLFSKRQKDTILCMINFREVKFVFGGY